MLSVRHTLKGNEKNITHFVPVSNKLDTEWRSLFRPQLEMLQDVMVSILIFLCVIALVSL